MRVRELSRLRRTTYLLAPAFAVALLACDQAVPVRGPDGQPGWFTIECHRSQAACYSLAGEQCPKGYVVADSSGHSGTYVNVNAYGAQAIPVYRGEMLIKCRSGEAEDPEDTRAAERIREESARVAAAALVVQKNPKFPELGATKPEAKATCQHERGEWIDQGEKVGCRIRGENVFACELADDASMRACTHWKLGADLTDERNSIMDANGKPTSVDTGERGFRTYTWSMPDKTITLSGYPAGVIVTEAQAEAAPPEDANP